jgi:hypothetical protein
MYLLRTHAAEISLLNLIPSFLCNTEMRYSNDFPGARNLPHSHTSPTEFDSYAAGNRGNAAVASCSMHAYEQSARDARTEGRASSAKSSSLRSLNTPVYSICSFVSAQARGRKSLPRSSNATTPGNKQETNATTHTSHADALCSLAARTRTGTQSEFRTCSGTVRAIKLAQELQVHSVCIRSCNWDTGSETIDREG